MGYDYGRGQSNIDFETGIRYGIIHQNKVPCIHDYLEPFYAPVTCPECDSTNVVEDGADWYCEDCDISFVYHTEDEPAWVYEGGGYLVQMDEQGDIWVFKSPFKTQAGFCSPCAPGAVYLTDRTPDAWGYCLGPEFFEEGEVPYEMEASK